MSEKQWWRSAVVYQVYPRSFADSNADGIGDLEGVRSRLDYLADLGVDAIWLSPFYPSPLADGGYDVSDYCNVDRRLGTLADFDRLAADAHSRGIKIIVDIVPNHTSEQHPWFKEALASRRGSSARARYVFADGFGDLPPSDWASHFGGSAWERVPDGQWYLHLFATQQPDLNWDHPEVRAFFLKVLRFWSDRGVDGFRVDVAHSLAKDLSLPLRSQPTLDRELPADGSDPLYDRDEVHEIFREWRRVFDSYDPPKMAVGEAWVPDPLRQSLYARPDELGQTFDFSLLKAAWNAEEYRRVIETSIAAQAGFGGANTWVLSNHDVIRHASRLALPSSVSTDAWLLSDGTEPPIDQEAGQRRARAAALLLLALPGSAYIYQGEELGLPEVADLPGEVLQDPTWERTGHRIKGRDGCRVPLPWTGDGSSFGFGANGSWLPQPAWFGEYAVAVQRGHEGSMLEHYRRALAVRRRLDLGGRDPLVWQESPEGVLIFDRGDGFRCVVNVSGWPYYLGREGGQVVASTLDVQDGLLPAENAAWLENPRPR